MMEENKERKAGGMEGGRERTSKHEEVRKGSRDVREGSERGNGRT